jgi:hypothetical protein
MKTVIVAVSVLALFAGACKKKEQPENIPQPKAEATTAAPAVSTSAITQNPLEAPGAYLKSTVGQINKAKAAAALYEESAKKSMQSADPNNTGGN